MEYITPKEASEKWGVGLRQVQFYCCNGKIPDAVRIGRQWFIPIDAEPPADGRKKVAKDNKNYDDYRFPGFILSKHYVSRSELNDEELLLLEAQIHTVKNNLVKSTEICWRLINSTISQNIKMGAYATKAYNCILLGLHTDLEKDISSMTQIRDRFPTHYEDYGFLIAYIKFNYTFDSRDLRKINTDLLSSDALLAYETVILLAAIFDNVNDSEYTLKAHSVFARYLDRLGITPAVLASHGILAHLYACLNNNERMEYHVREACRIGYTEGFYSLLSKYSSYHYNYYLEILNEYGKDFVELIDKIHSDNVSCFKATYGMSKCNKASTAFSQIEIEIMLLLSNGISVKSICNIKNITKEIFQNHINNIFNHLNIKTMDELVRNAKQIFAPEIDD